MSKQIRQQQILKNLKEGKSKKQIRSELSNQVSNSTLDRDFAEINKLVEKSNVLDADSLKLLLNERLETIYKLSLTSGKLDTALRTISEQAKLNGLLVDKQEIVDHTIQIEF